jgi:hypothetical protein
MRSAIYSLCTTLLLLVPVSAVPLMAVFGVPQFTPVVASPLDDSADEEWDRPSPRKPKGKAPRTMEQDPELTVEEAPLWDETSAKRAASPRKLKPDKKSDLFPEAPTEREQDLLFAPGRNTAKKQRPPAARATPIQRVAHETIDADESKGGAFAAMDELLGETVALDGVPAGGIPSYRRQRPGINPAERGLEKSASATKRHLPPSKPPTWTEAVRRLNELGIRNFRLEPGVRPGEFSFTCSYTHSKSPHVTRRFEAEADEPLTAVGKVLVQVEEWARQRDEAPTRLGNESREGRRGTD